MPKHSKNYRKRITVERVLQAYAVTGLQPKAETWLDGQITPRQFRAWRNGEVQGKPRPKLRKTQACALSAVAIAESVCTTMRDSDECWDNMDIHAPLYLGLSIHYTHGFLSGFDLDLVSLDTKTDAYRRGFKDGDAANTAVFNKPTKAKP